MARVELIPGDRWPEELRELTGADHLTPLEQGNLRVYAHRPELAVAYARFMAALRAPGELSPRLRELVRIRVAFHNQCRGCMALRRRGTGRRRRGGGVAARGARGAT